MVSRGFFSGSASAEKRRFAGEKENNANLGVEVKPVRLASLNYPTGDLTQPYAPDEIGDYIKDTEVKSYRDDRDTIKKYFTREDGGVFKDEDEFDRKMTTYYTDKDGKPAAVDAFGEKVDYDTAKIKRYIATDAKEDYQNKQKQSAKQKLDDAVIGLNIMTQKVDDLNYYKRNLTFNEKGEADPSNKYVLTGPEMRERMKYLGPNESMDKYGIIRNYKEQDEINKKNEAELNRLQKAKEETKDKNVFQKIGDTVGDVFNKLTGTLPAQGGTLQSQVINTSATTNIAQMGNVNPTVQRAREAVEKSVRQQTGMPSNPGSQRQTGVGVSAGNLSRHKAGPSTRSGGISRSTSRGQGGGSSSRSRGGTGTGRSNQGSKSSARGARGSTSSRSRGGTGSGRTSTSRTASKASRSRTGRSRSQCDIRTKIDIAQLTNTNLFRDDLADVAYFVKEIK